MRRGQTRQVDDFLKPHRPLSLSGLQCFFLRLPEKEEVGPYIEQQLSRVLALKVIYTLLVPEEKKLNERLYRV